MEEIKFKPGDVVKFVDVQPDSRGYGWVSQMSRFLGKIVTIEKWYREEQQHFYIKEDREGCVYAANCIHHILNKEEIAALEEQRKKDAEEFEERHKDKLCTAEAVARIANDVFGEDRVHGIQTGENMFSIIVRFPEIEITNSKEHKHIIRDLFIRVSVKIEKEYFDDEDDTKAFISFSGRRRVLTLKEYEGMYRHSHLPKSSHLYQEFCLGHSAFGMLISDLAVSLSEDAWTVFFLSLPNYLKWESLEGGPHITIDRIKYSGCVANSLLTEELKRLLPGIPKDVWRITENINIVHTHPSLYDYFNEHSRVRQLSGYTKEEYERREENALQQMKREYERHPLEWKGENLAPEIFVERDAQSSTISMDVIENYCDQLEQKAKEFLKNKSYNDARAKNRKKTFGETGVVEQATAVSH